MPIPTCVTCKHHVRRWTPAALINLLFGDSSGHHRCTHGGTNVTLDPITGKRVVEIVSASCASRRHWDYQGFCGESGKYWEAK